MVKIWNFKKKGRKEQQKKKRKKEKKEKERNKRQMEISICKQIWIHECVRSCV